MLIKDWFKDCHGNKLLNMGANSVEKHDSDP